MDEQAIAQVMHQTVREFFLRPHKSVVNSHFQNINAQPAREMIAITCIRYLDLHYRELGNKFQSAAGASVSSWSSKDTVELVRYLNKRPFIKYSIEFLTALKEGVNVDPNIPKPFFDLTANLRLQNCPSAVQICLLEGLTNSRTDTQRVQELNHLVGIAAENGYTVAVSNLLAAGAECNAALHCAAGGGHVITVRLLLDRGADTEAKGFSNLTPLHRAASNGHEAAIVLLLDRGADTEAVDSVGQTPLHMAVWNGHEAAIKLLLDRGADTEAKDFFNPTLLHRAASNGHEAAIGLLLDHGADTEAKDSSERTPLHMAASNGHEAAIGLLLDRGAATEAKDSVRLTPLHTAAIGGRLDPIRLVPNRSADIEAKDSSELTLLNSRRKRPSSCEATESRSSGHPPTSESKGTGSQTWGRGKRPRA